MKILIKLLTIPALVFYLLPLHAAKLENTPEIVFKIINKLSLSNIYLDSGKNYNIISDNQKKWKVFFADCDKKYQCQSMTFYMEIPVNHASLDDVNRLNESIRYIKISYDDPQKIELQLDVFLGASVNNDVVAYLFSRWLSDIARVTSIFGEK